MPRYHTAVFHIYTDELRATMTAWLNEQAAAGWRPITVSVITTNRLQTPQAFVLLENLD